MGCLDEALKTEEQRLNIPVHDCTFTDTLWLDFHNIVSLDYFNRQIPKDAFKMV